MSRIQFAFKRLQTNQKLQAMELYVLGNDPAALTTIPRNRSTGWSHEGYVLADALTPMSQWTDQDRRLVHAMAAAGMLASLGSWLEDQLKQEKAGGDPVGDLAREIASANFPAEDTITMFTTVRTFVRSGTPTSAGRFLLALSDAELKQAATLRFQNYYNLQLLQFLFEHTPDRVAPLVPELLVERGHSSNAESAAAMLLTATGKRFESEIVAFFRAMKDTFHRFRLGQALVQYDAASYRDEALAAARASLAGPSGSNNHGPVGEWMLQTYGREVVPDMVAYVSNHQPGGRGAWSPWANTIVAAAAKVLKSDALPVLRAGVSRDLALAAFTLPHLIALRDETQDDLIDTVIRRGLAIEPERFTTLASQWNPRRLAEPLWELMKHKSKPVRDAAARALAKLGDDSLPQAQAMFADKKADHRLSAVTLLSAINSPAATKQLEARLDIETDDRVRDQILLGLEAAWLASGRTVTRADINARMARSAGKTKSLKIDWLGAVKLPTLSFKDGEPLSEDAVRYLLYRQSRAKEIRPDVEARALFEMIDRSTSGDFALTILNAYVSSSVDAGDRWALAVAGQLGDDRVVTVLHRQIRQWVDASRGKMAEYAVDALALLGSDAALLTIDALAIRYRSKNKNVGKAAVDAFALAAERLGITPEELGDRVVPWLGFEPGQPRLVDCGAKKFEARIGLDMKLKFLDLEKKKLVASLPKTAAKETLAEFKELAAALRDVVKAQNLRLENLMVRQQRWPLARWRELFTGHPLLRPMAVRLVWGVYTSAGTLEATFRALEDGSLTQAGDDPFELLGDGAVGIVHPLELTDALCTAWKTHLADYEIDPPFPQLDRAVVRLEADQANRKMLTDFAGISLNGMTFKGRAERLGWTRGSVCDGGGITSYTKTFPSAGADAFLVLDGMYIGMGVDSEVKLDNAYFVKAGSVRIGSYTYDDPGGESDPRVFAFQDVPPIVYSEVLGDLRKISGKAESQTE